MNRLDRSRSRLAAEVERLRGDLDDMLAALQVHGAEGLGEARIRYDNAARRARVRMAQTKAEVKARALRAAGDADVYAHRHPWRTGGAMLAAGIVLGALVGILTQSRRD